MRQFIILLFIFSIGCNPNTSRQNQDSPNDSKNENKIAGPDTNLRPLTHKKQLLGIWESENKEPLTIEISKDSIYYTEHFESYKYNLNADSIFINYPDFVYAGKIYFNKDTLIIESEDGKSKYVKFKK